jgi:hypothetical protein
MRIIPALAFLAAVASASDVDTDRDGLSDWQAGVRSAVSKKPGPTVTPVPRDAP